MTSSSPSVAVIIWATLAALAIAVLIWSTLIERNAYAVRKESLRILPRGSKPIAVLHIGDIHLAPWQKRKKRWVAGLARLQPDLVINTGDNLGHIDAVEPALAALAPLMKFPGVFVNGSNDLRAPVPRNPFEYLRKPSERSEGPELDTAKLHAGFRAAGWLNLNNREGLLEINGLKLGFLGVDDAHDDLDDLDSLRVQRNRLDGSGLIIGVSHAPYLRVLEAMTTTGASLIFAGHTHGGQVCVPGFGALTTNCDLPVKHAKGLSSWKFGGRHSVLNVVAGLGHSIYAPVRFACRPEVRLLTLLPRA
jgi:predicted MPP superfamily phosphohydrolase